MDNLGYLWAATGVVWLITLAYVATLIRRQEKLQKELEYLKESLMEAQ